MQRRVHLMRFFMGSAMLLTATVFGNEPAHASCHLEQQGEGRVAAIIDARTFRLDDGQEVRLAGIEPTAETTASILATLIDGREVTLHGSNDIPDRYGRLPAFTFIANSQISIQKMLLAQGAAFISAPIADKDCMSDLLQAEAEARLARRGLWGNPVAIKKAESTGDILTKIGQFTVIEGKVVSARQAGATFYINFGHRWTRDFAVTVSKRMMPSFEAAGVHLTSLENKWVRICGWVERHGGPRIEASYAYQIELMGNNEAALRQPDKDLQNVR